ncbi:hypothetical protein J5N97_013251 [Dioscorea zingiberensis]|uniref:VQ domain-containing protein n=1 Tax=Dioscorea zingiberensis TaxID=325984 RepID=A0A9D5HIV4_9LILI|nr:hypothetical protein J5N97_013251 [Dioscorea zingiberensis]
MSNDHHLRFPQKVIDLQGSRPTPLVLHKESHKINKSPTKTKKPVVIYLVSPKIIHAEPGEFMALVQRLTGPASSAAAHGSEVSQAKTRSGQFPVRVKARPFTGTAATKRSPSHSPVLSPATLFLNDLTPLSEGGCAQRWSSLASQGWLLHGKGIELNKLVSLLISEAGVTPLSTSGKKKLAAESLSKREFRESSRVKKYVGP